MKEELEQVPEETDADCYDIEIYITTRYNLHSHI